MHPRFLARAISAILILALPLQTARAQPDSVLAHIRTARAAANGPGATLFNLCPLVQPPPQPVTLPGGQFAPVAGRPAWYTEPRKVFDNLYFVGQTEYSAWAVTTPEGIIVIDAIYEYSVEQEVVEGLRKLGLDPATIRYVIISHAHADHSGGARFLQDRGARIVMSAADWDLLDSAATRASARAQARGATATNTNPKRDIIATDGYKLTLGGTTITLHLTPGHTPGTMSSIIPVTDNGQRHIAAAWGGTAFNFTVTPDKPRDYWFRTYIESAERFRGIVRVAGADVLIANHTNFDGSKAKLATLSTRRAGDPHPYVVGGQGIAEYLTVAAECAKAQLAGMR